MDVEQIVPHQLDMGWS